MKDESVTKNPFADHIPVFSSIELMSGWSFHDPAQLIIDHCTTLYTQGHQWKRICSRTLFGPKLKNCMRANCLNDKSVAFFVNILYYRYGHGYELYCVAGSPDGKMVASACKVLERKSFVVA